MRKSGRKILKRIQQRNLNEEINCINAMQRTPYRVNEDVMTVLSTVWELNVPVTGLVQREQIELEPYPFEVEPSHLSVEERRLFKDWRARRNSVHQLNAQNMSKRLQIERTLHLAQEYRRYEEFYYVWQLDFRSRKYPVSDFMNPQSADFGKALLEFARGVRIEQEEDARWLAIHGANCFGEDKISLDEREDWAYNAEADVVKTVENPYEYTWWMGADKPFQFMAWCCEWYRYLKEGLGFVTHLPVSADGSCNGLQHLSAILLDERGGKSVNLTPEPMPNDIYHDVAEAAKLLVIGDAMQGHELAKQLVAFGIDRKVSKRSVMIVPYSGTQYACRSYIEDALKDKIATGVDAPFDTFEASLYLCQHVWDSIGNVISSAKDVMNFIKDIGREYAKKRIPMEWITPSDFLVIQDYPDLETKRIKTLIDGNIIKLNFKEPVEHTVSRSKTVSGSSPNFIHSLDACALTRTVNRCTQEGITQFAMVHDSYGTHSPNLPLMQDILREEFVKMYQENDVLADLRNHAIQTLGHDNLPDLPSRGNLDLNQVLKSQYFFA